MMQGVGADCKVSDYFQCVSLFGFEKLFCVCVLLSILLFFLPVQGRVPFSAECSEITVRLGKICSFFFHHRKQ